MLLLADASPTLPSLPTGYTPNVTSGSPITTPLWQTVGFRTVTNLKVGFPQVVEFDLPSTMLPPPSRPAGAVALLSGSDSPFSVARSLHEHANGYRARLRLPIERSAKRTCTSCSSLGPRRPAVSPTYYLSSICMGSPQIRRLTWSSTFPDIRVGFGLALPKELATPSVLAGQTIDSENSCCANAAAASTDRVKSRNGQDVFQSGVYH